MDKPDFCATLQRVQVAMCAAPQPDTPLPAPATSSADPLACTSQLCYASKQCKFAACGGDPDDPLNTLASFAVSDKNAVRIYVLKSSTHQGLTACFDEPGSPCRERVSNKDFSVWETAMVSPFNHETLVDRYFRF
jgi:hypothetical protein